MSERVTSTGPGSAAQALLDPGSDAYAALPADDLREGVVELVAAQEAVHEGVQEGAQETAPDVARGDASEVAREAAPDVAREAAPDVGREAASEVAREAVEEPAGPQDPTTGIELALTRVLALGVPDVDVRLVARLAERPSAARLGSTCRALRLVWSPDHPHPAIDPVTVGRLVGSAERVTLGPDELGVYRAVLALAAGQVGSPGAAAAIRRELTRLAPAADGG